MKKAFDSVRRNGFHMTFPNGLTASIQWGVGTYSDNHFSTDFDFQKGLDSNTAEVAVLDSSEKFVDLSYFGISVGDDVAGYLTSSEVVDFLVKVRDY